MFVALNYKIWWQFKSQKYYEGLYGKKLLNGKPCYPASFSHKNSLSRGLVCEKVYIYIYSIFEDFITGICIKIIKIILRFKLTPDLKTIAARTKLYFFRFLLLLLFFRCCCCVFFLSLAAKDLQLGTYSLVNLNI